ncbi:TetR/AcrR family transcriptional regulator, partial [bacterium]|nr:TetR/AcrR family transcriptional regulator [bacterium]
IDPEKRKKILTSATRVFSEKGFVDATIFDIGNGADIVASGVYKHFSGKEEILFTIIESFLTESFEKLSDHLEGIRGAENKLRKAIWFHCKEYSKNKQLIKIVLESRSYLRFYQSTAHEAMRRYAALYTDMIREGMDQGEILGLSSPELLRDMILGTVDHIAINWTMKDAPNTLDQADKIFEMVMDAVRPVSDPGRPLSKKDAKRARIIEVASDLFAEKGFNDTSMMEIAKVAEVAEGTVYEYFGNKEQLLITIPNVKLGELHNHISGVDVEKRLRIIIADIFHFYQKEKQFTKILVLMLRANRRFHFSESNQIIDSLFGVLSDLIRCGQKARLFKDDLDLSICQHLLFGTVDHVIIPWIMFERDYDFKSIGTAVADLFINAIKSRTPF